MHVFFLVFDTLLPSSAWADCSRYLQSARRIKHARPLFQMTTIRPFDPALERSLQMKPKSEILQYATRVDMRLTRCIKCVM